MEPFRLRGPMVAGTVKKGGLKAREIEVRFRSQGHNDKVPGRYVTQLDPIRKCELCAAAGQVGEVLVYDEIEHGRSE